jgi:uncharacterized protein (DUF2062 family)
MTDWTARFGIWRDAAVGRLRAHMPSREALARNRWLRPIAHRLVQPALWRFTRRSVPRGVAIGFFIGVAVPFAHTPLAMVVAVGARANLPLAAASTWISNPFTWVMIYPLAWRIGGFLLHLDRAAGWTAAPHVVISEHGHMLHRIAGAGARLASGVVIEALVLAVVGYAVTALLWRLKVVRRRRLRGNGQRLLAASATG